MRFLALVLVVAFAATSCQSSETLTSPAQTRPVQPSPAPTTAAPTTAVLPTPTAAEQLVPPTPEPTVPTETPTPSATVEATATPVPYRPGAAVAVYPGSPIVGVRVGLIANPASALGDASSIDALFASEPVNLVALFAPEHGVRGDLGAGELVPDGVDQATGLPLHSLYGQTRAPTEDMLADIDVLVYDLQGVGARFYTYDSTLGLAMQSAAAADIPFVVLDRPNPLAASADGYVREQAYESFIGQYPVPALHGLTAGELAVAIVGEGWLDGLDALDLTVISMQGWSPRTSWAELGVPWVAPSPGLPSAEAARAYPATVWFEATTLSYGRGTDEVFQQVGAPWIEPSALIERLTGEGLPGVEFEPVEFTPVPTDAASNPQFVNETVRGVRLVVTDEVAFRPVLTGVALLTSVVELGAEQGRSVIDRPDFLDLLAGTDTFRTGIESGWTLDQHEAAWRSDLETFAENMDTYRLYPD